jgi:protocatechuate 3,4-dioxygenase beta subunit
VRRALRLGRVVDADGRPVAGALVSVVWGTAPTPEIGRRTRDDGRFQVGLPPGQFRIQAVTVSGSAGEVEVEGGQGDEILIRIDRPR